MTPGYEPRAFRKGIEFSFNPWVSLENTIAREMESATLCGWFLVRIPQASERSCLPQRPSTGLSRVRYEVQHPAEEVKHDYFEYDEDSQYYCRGDDNDAWLTWPPPVKFLSLANERSDAISERDQGGPAMSCNEEETLDHNAAVEQDTSSVTLSSGDPVVDTGLEVGDILTSSKSDDEVSFTNIPTAKRLVKPVIRLSYDEPGEPTNKPLVIGR
ncbi:hypothetical protein CRENBAI_025549 [Crenichthys baileyi]|uniref:Uncharacterized protein n=1 Tax=Crenichthys baileyi TaxID=28760 RepID=A0AAV9RC47_9TELE